MQAGLLGGQIKPPAAAVGGGKTPLSKLARLVRQFIVQRSRNQTAVAIAQRGIGSAELSLMRVGRFITPAFTAWGSHETGAILGCAIGAATLR